MTNANETRPQEVQLTTQNTRARRGSLEHANAKVSCSHWAVQILHAALLPGCIVDVEEGGGLTTALWGTRAAWGMPVS